MHPTKEAEVRFRHLQACDATKALTEAVIVAAKAADSAAKEPWHFSAFCFSNDDQGNHEIERVYRDIAERAGHIRLDDVGVEDLLYSMLVAINENIDRYGNNSRTPVTSDGLARPCEPPF